jgi:hypothetical protein
MPSYFNISLSFFLSLSFPVLFLSAEKIMWRWVTVKNRNACQEINKRKNGDGVMFQSTVPAFRYRNWENQRVPSVRTAIALPGIQINFSPCTRDRTDRSNKHLSPSSHYSLQAIQYVFSLFSRGLIELSRANRVCSVYVQN